MTALTPEPQTAKKVVVRGFFDHYTRYRCSWVSLEGEEEAYTGAVMGEDTAYSVTSPPLSQY